MLTLTRNLMDEEDCF